MLPAQSSTPILINQNVSSTIGLSADATGDIYIADGANNAVLEIKPSGGYYLNSSLPVGLTFNSATGVISGTPASASAAKNTS